MSEQHQLSSLGSIAKKHSVRQLDDDTQWVFVDKPSQVV